MITSKPANGPNPGHKLLYCTDRSFGKNFLVSSAENVFADRKFPLPIHSWLDWFGC
jgi:hypothetical protein